MHAAEDRLAFADMEGPNFRLDGRVALLTGAGRGIGLGIARALAWAGCAVAIHDLDLDVAQQEAEAIVAGGARAAALGGDITDPTLPPRLVREAVERFGGVDILVNNASIQSVQHWTKLDQEEFDRTMLANCFTPLALCQQVEPMMRAKRWGRIVNIGSIQQLTSNETMLAYALSKIALDGMTIALARDLAKSGVTVNNLAPGYFQTVRNPQLGSAENRQKAGAKIPVGRVGQPEDAAGAALLLCSPAGEYITGQTIYVDGGMSARGLW
jgi:NAD(P)-dependent dehydrogenase (short-subunit alcohol dehydrogenase family)